MYYILMMIVSLMGSLPLIALLKSSPAIMIFACLGWGALLGLIWRPVFWEPLFSKHFKDPYA